MKTPAWVITGMLDSGKTTLINSLIERELDELGLLVLQFETGETPLLENENVKKLTFSKRELEQSAFKIADSVFKYLEEHCPDLILIEWNGMEHFHKLEEMFLQFSAREWIGIEKVVYVADHEGLRSKIPDAGALAFSQIAGSGCAFVRSERRRQLTEDAGVLYDCNPEIRLFDNRRWPRFARWIFDFKLHPGIRFLAVLTVAVICVVGFSLSSDFGFPAGRYISMFLGVFLQAVPFLAIGVLLSSLLQVYVSPDWIQRKFPTNIMAGQLFAVVAGFCLPVCDCAAIPVFKGLVRKGVPLPAAVTFMLASPVINPVVILSTWYAFNGNYRMILARCGLGIVCAVVCGLTYLVKPPVEYLLDSAVMMGVNCEDFSLPEEKDGQMARFSKMIRHAQNEFFAVGKFLLTGIFVSTLFQDLIPSAMLASMGITAWKALLLMMGLAFLLSLCSSSDAVVARSMAGSLPSGAILGFLVFGPMMDIKNTAMLLSGFKSGFVVRLFVTVFIVCFIVIALFMMQGSGGIRI